MGVFGHSVGGATAIEALVQDTRIDAAVNLDGTIFTEKVSGIKRPTLTIATQYVDVAAITDAELATMGISRENFQKIIAVTNRNSILFQQSSEAQFVTIAGTQHMNFSDAGLLAPLFPALNFALGEIDPRRALEITDAYLLEFFNETLRGEASAIETLSTTYPESTLQTR